MTARVRDASKKRDWADMREMDGEFAKEDAFWKLRLGSGESYHDYLSESPEITDDFTRLEYPYYRAKPPA